MSEFYKDEGGKSNFLTMVVGVPPGYPLVGPIPLKASLYFERCAYFARADDPGPASPRSSSCECVCACPSLCPSPRSERRVEEKDQAILNLMGREYLGFEISPENPTAVFEFRLEKVRRGACVCVCACASRRRLLTG